MLFDDLVLIAPTKDELQKQMLLSNKVVMEDTGTKTEATDY